MSAHEQPHIPHPDQPAGPGRHDETEEIERLKAELGDRVGMLRDRRPAGGIHAVVGAARRNPVVSVSAAAAVVGAVLVRVTRR